MMPHPRFGRHPLSGVHEKVLRVENNLQVLENEIGTYEETSEYSWDIEKDPQGEVWRIRIPPLPPRWGMLIDESIHHLRSSLDHLVWRLIRTTVFTPTRDKAFPVATKDRSQIGARLNRVPDAATAFIEGLQPYQSVDPDSHPLAVLHLLSNVTKHRDELLTVAAFFPETSTFYYKGAAETVPEGGPFYDGAIFMAFAKGGPKSYEVDVDIQGSIEVSLDIWDMPLVHGRKPIALLQELCEFVRDDVIAGIEPIINQLRNK